MKNLLIVTLFFLASMAKAQTTLKYKYPGVSPVCGCPYNGWCRNDINCGNSLCHFNPSSLDFQVIFSVPPPGGTVGLNPYKMFVELFFNGSVIGTQYFQGNTPFFTATFFSTSITSGQYNAKVLFEKRTAGGWKVVNNYWTSSISINLCPPCNNDVIISGSLTGSSLIQSGTWIKTDPSAGAIIQTGATIKLDANPVQGYILLSPGFEVKPGAVFIARVLDGCGPGIPM